MQPTYPSAPLSYAPQMQPMYPPPPYYAPQVQPPPQPGVVNIQFVPAPQTVMVQPSNVKVPNPDDDALVPDNANIIEDAASRYTCLSCLYFMLIVSVWLVEILVHCNTPVARLAPVLFAFELMSSFHSLLYIAISQITSLQTSNYTNTCHSLCRHTIQHIEIICLNTSHFITP